MVVFKLLYLEAILCLSLLTGTNCDKPYKICSLLRNVDDCAQLGRGEDVLCENDHHGVDCILNVEQGKSDFGRITPEEALVAAKFVKNVVVIGELRADAIQDDALYATAVLVKTDHVNGLKGLKGKKYCHPGFQFEEETTELILKEFEYAVLKENNAEGCSNKVESGTLFEKELKAVSDFFGPSCRPGPWVDIEESNNKLSQRYSKLCELCPSSGQCTDPPGTAPFTQSLECLVNRGGEVALTTLNSINEFFNKSENANKKGSYQYLCRNGSVASMNNPCIWSKQPWNLIIANEKQADVIKNNLKTWLPKSIIGLQSPALSASFQYEQNLESVLFPKEGQNSKINLTSNLIPLKDYIIRYREIPSARNIDICNDELKWCTVSDEEQQKCLWLSQASLNRAILPVLSCVQSPSKLDCLEDIKIGRSDVVTSDAYYGYIARRKNLAALAYPETDRKYLINTILVIKASNELNIERFENLKTRKACMPEYGGIEWLSFINAASEHKVLSKETCDYGELISEFVGDSCIPGAHDVEHERSLKTDGEKLCNLCVPNPYYSKTATTCNTDKTNKYYGSLGALKCLQEAGDFAVITKENEDYRKINASEFRVLCKNGSLALQTGFNVDAGCFLTTIVDSEVISKRNGSKNADIGVALLNFEKRFGTARVKAFEVFNIFNNTLDLLFKDSTAGLAPVTSNNPNIKNYISLFEHLDKCSVKNDNGSACSLQGPLVSLLLAFVLHLFIRW